MSFDNYMGKEHRKPYKGSKRFDHTCRNHGGCPACLANRTIAIRKRQQSADSQLAEFMMESRNLVNFSGMVGDTGITSWNEISS